MPYKLDMEVDGDILTESDDDSINRHTKSTWQRDEDIYKELPDFLKDVNRAGYDIFHNSQSPSHQFQPEDMDDLIDLDSDTEQGTKLNPEHHQNTTNTIYSDPAPAIYQDQTTSATASPALTRPRSPSISFQIPVTQHNHPSKPPPLLRVLHETLTLHTKINYDHIAARFYSDSRIRHTGIPLLPSPSPFPTALRNVDLSSYSAEFPTLHLTVRSAWRHFATIYLVTTGDARVHIAHWSLARDAPRIDFSRAFLRWWFECALPSIDGYWLSAAATAAATDGKWRQQSGMTWTDICALTSVFRVEPDVLGRFEDEDSMWWKDMYYGDWMNDGVEFSSHDEKGG